MAADNATNATSGQLEPLMQGNEKIVVPALFAVIFLAGIIGNGILMFIVARNKSMRNVPNIFIFSLATGDFLLILTSVPMSATLYAFNDWPYGLFMCRLNYYMQTLSLTVTVFTLTALSCERFFAIIKPMMRRKGNPKRTTLLVAIGIWLVGFIFAIPDAILTRLMVYHDETSNASVVNCFNYHPAWGFYYAKFIIPSKFTILFAVPVIIITGLYISMATTLLTSGQNIPGEDHGQYSQNKMIAARRKVAFLVLLFSVLFFICWFPRHVYQMWYYFDVYGEYNRHWHYFKMAGFVMSFLNSCVNPVALYFLSAQFRKYYHYYICCRCIRQNAFGAESTSGIMMQPLNSIGNKNSTSVTAVQTQM